MLKRLPAALLFGGLLLSLTPGAAGAAMAPHGYQDGGSQDGGSRDGGNQGGGTRDDHYRCMYHCEERGYRPGESYNPHDRSRSGPDRQSRTHHGGGCWSYDRWGWHRCRSGFSR